jgi:hypothetical protein
MYVIRSLQPSALLHVELSGCVSTEEALRAISQAATLASVDGAVSVLCDVSAVSEAPDTLVPAAVLLGSAISPAMRVAVVSQPHQQPLIEKLMRVARVRRLVRFFQDQQSASAWLASASRRRISETGLRHATEPAKARANRRRRDRLAARVTAA